VAASSRAVSESPFPDRAFADRAVLVCLMSHGLPPLRVSTPAAWESQEVRAIGRRPTVAEPEEGAGEHPVVVVTGGTAGIGRAVVREFAGHGYDVAVLARGTDALDAAVADVGRVGRRGLAFANRVAPGLVDRYIARTAISGQQEPSHDPPSPRTNTWEPRAGDPGAHGEFDDEAHARSPQAWLTRHRGVALTGGLALAGAAAMATHPGPRRLLAGRGAGR
jgi:hypothetical protein